mmetsp:Transcript_3242/g.7180  ORF Transcript_3242/g.7180 Transcript_3242/m.7180 type:complete len:266 (+) Transcript_3242:1216-2013(+)
MRSSLSLHVALRVPVAVRQNHGISRLQIKAEATRARRYEIRHKRRALLVEPASLVRTPSCGSLSVETQVAVLTRLESSLDDVEKASELRKDDAFTPLGNQSRQNAVKHLHLSRAEPNPFIRRLIWIRAGLLARRQLVRVVRHLAKLHHEIIQLSEARSAYVVARCSRHELPEESVKLQDALVVDALQRREGTLDAQRDQRRKLRSQHVSLRAAKHDWLQDATSGVHEFCIVSLHRGCGRASPDLFRVKHLRRCEDVWEEQVQQRP